MQSGGSAGGATVEPPVPVVDDVAGSVFAGSVTAGSVLATSVVVVDEVVVVEAGA
uniref:Unannotated protein n=1 Tax=freshwater metagenome TaxID=449393 RepID=A0A6J7NH14_9ZZZZ